MPSKIEADASPEKRLFAYLLTRDISLTDALLDLIDNSINAALQPLSDRLKTADDYLKLFHADTPLSTVSVSLTVGSSRIVVEDTAHGIPLHAAEKDIFRLGRDVERGTEGDTLSVYGIGLKRAMFKCGNHVHITSDHHDGGFALDLNIRKWERLKQDHWSFPISTRPPEPKDVGTRIIISELYDDVIRRLEDGLFLTQLRDRIARTYSFFIGRIVTISLNGVQIPEETFQVGDNFASERFSSGSVSCNITAGLAKSTGDSFRERNSGWFVFCNGRTVLAADKTPVTGWGAGGLPLFQPKHRPFLGTVFFVSSDPEALPWTTTKGAINEESATWQEAKRHMVKVGRVITSFLDSRYGEDSGGVAPAELQTASGRGVSVLTAAVSNSRVFQPPIQAKPKEIKVQYFAKVADIGAIEKYLRRPNMGGSEVGRYTFNWFLKNEVGGDS